MADNNDIVRAIDNLARVTAAVGRATVEAIAMQAENAESIHYDNPPQNSGDKIKSLIDDHDIDEATIEREISWRKE